MIMLSCKLAKQYFPKFWRTTTSKLSKWTIVLFSIEKLCLLWRKDDPSFFNFAILKSILSFSHFAHSWYYWPFLGPKCFFSKAGVLFNWLYLILFKCGFLSNRYWLTRRIRNAMIDEVYDKEKWNCNVCCDKISTIFSKAPNVVY